MAVGTSGRIVIDVDPALKRRLHSALRQDAKSLKDWFLERCREYLAERQQPRLFDVGRTADTEAADARRDDQ